MVDMKPNQTKPNQTYVFADIIKYEVLIYTAPLPYTIKRSCGPLVAMKPEENHLNHLYQNLSQDGEVQLWYRIIFPIQLYADLSSNMIQFLWYHPKLTSDKKGKYFEPTKERL